MFYVPNLRKYLLDAAIYVPMKWLEFLDKEF